MLVVLAVIALIVVGVLILWLIVHTLKRWLPAVVVAVLVYIVSHNLTYAAGSFFFVSLLMVLFRHR